MSRTSSTSSTPVLAPPGHSQIMGRLGRLVLKELREILRDRRTIITLVVMPVLMYPLLALVFQRFLLTSLTVESQAEYTIGVESEGLKRELERQLQLGSAALERQHHDELQQAVDEIARGSTETRPPWPEGAADSLGDNGSVIRWVEVTAEAAERHVMDSAIHLAVLSRRLPDDRDELGLNSPKTWELVFRPGSPTSEQTLRFVESRLKAYINSDLDQQLRQLGVAVAVPATFRRHAVEFAGAPSFSLAALIPLILVLMTVTGAVYPAIDLTAGERERGTLETLIAAPVPRLGLLLGKYVAVLTVALLTALVNLVGMTVTAHSSGLAESLFGENGMSLVVVLKVLMLLGLFAAFFSAVLLALTSYARSFKEAQAYIIPLMLFCLVPGVLCLMPSLEFHGILAIAPLVNIVLLARDLLEGSVDTSLAVVAVFSTALYVVAAIALAARIFGTDAILYGSQATWADIFRRPTSVQPAASTSAAMSCLAMMFPCYFVLSSTLARSPDFAMRHRLVIGGLITAMVFGAIPALLALFNRVRLSSGMGLKWSGILGLLAAALLGLALWPAAHEVFLANQWLGLTDLSSQQPSSVKNVLEQWKDISPVLILITLALVPGVFEELFFRGFLFTSLRSTLSARATVLVAALLFGLFHVVAANVLAPERFLPSTFLGLVLGWVRLRTGSVLPCMVLHTMHNGLLLSVACWQDQLIARGIGVQETAHLPASWLMAALVGIAIAATMIVVTTKSPQPALQPG